MRTAYIILLLLISALMSCTHKELCYDHSHIVSLDVKFDWSNAPDASPKSMSLYLFSEDGTKPQRYELSGREGGRIRLSRGVYHAVCLNSDTRNIECRDKSDISTFLITSRDENYSNNSMGVRTMFSAMMQNENRANERYARQPEMLWIGRGYDFAVEQDGDVMELTLDQAVAHISIAIHNVNNMRNVASVAGTISGLSEGILAGTGEHNGVCATHPFEIERSEDYTSLHGELLAFGDCWSGDEKHYVDIYTVLADGSQWKYSYDVTDEVHKAEDDLYINIVLDGLPVPEPAPGTGSGIFAPSLDEWKNIDQEIQM